MPKEYTEEKFQTEPGKTERRTIGPAYFEDSSEFKREMTTASACVRQAVFDLFADAHVHPEVLEHLREADRKKSQERALSFASFLAAELRGVEHDATLPLAAVEAGIGLLDFKEGARERRVEESEEDFQEAVEGVQEARETRKDFERASEFLFSVHPYLTKLYGRDDLIDWMRYRADNIVEEAKKLSRQGDDSATIAPGQMVNEEASLRRYLAGTHVPADYDAILLQVEEAKTRLRRDLAGFLMVWEADAYEKWEDSKKERDRMVHAEEMLSQFYQMDRMLEEERRRLRSRR